MTGNNGVLLIFIGILAILILSIPVAGSAYTITATAGSHGTIDPSGSVTGNPGGSQTFWIYPESGYHIIMTIDGAVTAGSNPYTFTNVNSDHTLDVTFAPDTGFLSVNSDPTGASIFIDGIDSGKKTSTSLDVPVGQHDIRLTRAGYDDYTTSVTVEKGKTTKVDKNLDPQTPTTTTPVSVISTPSGASVSLDGVYKGTTPVVISSVLYGTHTLLLTKTGYRDSSNQVTVSANSNTFAYTLTATPVVPPTTPVSVSSTPSGASVYLDGTNSGVTPLTIPSVSYGTHTLRLTYNGYQDSSNTVTVSASSNAYTYTLTPISVGTTTPISVSSTPSGASVYLDGTNKGATSLTIPSVSYGIHTLRLTYNGYQDSSNTVTVSETLNAYTYTLTAISVGTTTPISVSSTPSGATVYLDGTSMGTTPLPIPSVPYGTHTLILKYSGYQDSSNQITVSETLNAYGYTLTPTGQVSVVVDPTTLPTTVPTTGNTTVVPTATPVQTTTATPSVTPTVSVSLNVVLPAGTSPTDTMANGYGNATEIPIQPTGGLPPSNVVIFLLIALIPLFLLLAHDYLGLGHLSFSQPLAIRTGVAIGQVACGIGLIFVLSTMIYLIPGFGSIGFLILIVLMLLAYLIFSALALAIGSLLSRPLRWTMRVHVVIGVITLVVTPMLLFLFAEGDIMVFITPILVPIVVTIIAAPVSALLALWQNHTLVLQLHLHK